MSGPDLSPEQRAWLGIGEQESLRVLSAGPRTVLLERSSADAGTALPWDRDLVLTADIGCFTLADVLHLLHRSAKSGFLQFEDCDHAKSIYLHRGEVVFATSNQTHDRLGDCLLRVGMITPEQFREAVRLYRPGKPFGKLLVERGFLNPRELWNAVKVQVEEIVRSLFSHSAGNVSFWEGEIRPDNVVRLSLPTRRLIADGLRRRDELLKFLAWLEDPRVGIEPVTPENLRGAERALFDAIESGDRFADVCRKAGVDPLAGARMLFHLRLLGAARVERSEGPEAEAAAADGQAGEEALRQMVLAHVKLLAELAAPIVAVEGGDGLRERLQGVAEEAARRFPEILSGAVVGPGGVLDPTALTAKALRVPRERERAVRLALGELVSYVEFELVNHPKITEPEQFLEGLESLRSGL